MLFTIFHLFNSKKIPDTLFKIPKYFLKYLNIYKNTIDGKWLNDLNLSEIEFYFCYNMTNENQILGSYEPLFGDNKLFIKPIDEARLTRKEIYR